MNIKEKADLLINEYRKIQGDLYNQIEKVEYSIILLKEKKSSFFAMQKTKNKISELSSVLAKYKETLQAHANYIDVKLSVLTKEIQKPDATIDSLNKINRYKYSDEKNLQLPEEVIHDLSKFGIKFNEQDKVNLYIEESESAEFCM